MEIWRCYKAAREKNLQSIIQNSMHGVKTHVQKPWRTCGNAFSPNLKIYIHAYANVPEAFAVFANGICWDAKQQPPFLRE